MTRAAFRLTVGAGEARGRHLLAAPGARPTEALVKAAMFNMVGPTVLDALVLDLFAGSGALGIEALSRGARSATFVEASRACASILRQNLDALGYYPRCRLEVADALRWLATHQEEVAAATLILLDPPYDDPTLATVLERLDALTRTGTVVVAEHRSGAQLPPSNRLLVTRERRYGGSSLTVLQAA